MKLHFKKRQFYDRTRKMSITSANVKDLENQCALQHHDKFLKKQKANKDAMKKFSWNRKQAEDAIKPLQGRANLTHPVDVKKPQKKVNIS